MNARTVLYVEDNDDNVYVLRNRLERAGYRVLVATDGAVGVDMARSESPDLIVLDLILPGVDGWEAARRLRADPETEAIPIIALSSSAMPDDRQRALDAGCDRFDTKPVDFARLEGLINELLSD